MKFLDMAIEMAQRLGADYADIRIQRTREDFIYLLNVSLKYNHQKDLYGYGIRVLKNGAWGFAHNNVFTEDEVAKTVRRAIATAELSSRAKRGNGLQLAPERSYMATYRTPVQIDPFAIPLREKVDLMLETNRAMLQHEGIRQTYFALQQHKDEKLFASTLGTRLDLTTQFLYPRFGAVAVTPEDSQSRTFDEGSRAVGWEWMNQINFEEKSRTIAEEALMKARADSLGEEKRRDLILDPGHLGLTMHESVGHPTELDRVLGWEADYAGISFATPEKLGNYRYASEIVNFVGDNTLAGGMATAGFDDDGVPGQKWHIIKNGILVEYGTTRDTAPLIGAQYSRGCNRAEFYSDMPINRIPNLYMLPGEKELTPSELIADTEDGVYISDRGTFSIDQHRVNFQFGGDLFYEIKNGKITRPLKKIIYKSNNPEFWNSCDAICDQRFWKPFGVNNCGKGQPNQSGRMTHGSSTARFRQIRVGGSQ